MAESYKESPQTHADAPVNASASFYSASSADACGHGQYYWQMRKCLRPHISHLQWWASIAMAITMSHCGCGRAA